MAGLGFRVGSKGGMKLLSPLKAGRSFWRVAIIISTIITAVIISNMMTLLLLLVPGPQKYVKSWPLWLLLWV